jgi:hypothetical protein
VSEKWKWSEKEVFVPFKAENHPFFEGYFKKNG